ncbi:hypothetical protein RLEG3_31125 [Rhizobium leguminosarum bv. trifolii WSM1689]|uniref:hypothetical protein n=1 Tax=Rhizobium leguminosarum TaxID=384 RepID=UPI0003E0AB14|nr:hypothetical protein [Rhizobium leguminosarum]AHF86824.1 hypothetical protein RLEG3_31125 [Rhizobium leguminosarum bv. trifolii WSM1689]
MKEQFKLPGSSMDEVCRIIMGYARLDKPANLSEISKATGVPDTTVSRNAGFLVSIGVLENGAKKAPTELGRRLGHALMHNVDEEVTNSLSEIVTENEFLKNLVGAVRIRRGMDEGSLRSHIAYSAGANKSTHTATGTSTVVEFLKRAGHIRDEDGKIVVISPSELPRSSDADTQSIQPSVTAAIKSPTALTLSVPPVAGSPFAITINIEVKCGVEDLDDLGIKLRQIVEDFKGETSDGAEDKASD